MRVELRCYFEAILVFAYFSSKPSMILIDVSVTESET